jgi:anti-sigma regulatory factor (Ser/Thr protein kinase)
VLLEAANAELNCTPTLQRFGNDRRRENLTMTLVIPDVATVSLELDSRPQSVTLVRSALSGLGERLGFGPELLDDLRTAVSEACNNVVMHAYPDGVGTLVVLVEVAPDRIDVLVRDHGTGIQRVSAAEDRMGVGLAVISALADRAAFLSASDGGTEVKMTFNRDGEAAESTGETAVSWDGQPLVELTGDVVMSLSPVSILGNVFGRLARAAAAGSHFSVDRFSDLYPITDAIATFAEEAGTEGPLTCSISASSRRLELTLAPFVPGTGSQFAHSRDGTMGAPPLVGLADELTVENLDGCEMLRVVVEDSRAAPTVQSTA